MFAHASKLIFSVQALFAPFRKSSTSSSSTSKDKLCGSASLRRCRCPGVAYTRPPRVTVKEIAARFDAKPQTLSLPSNLPSISSESETRALRMPRRTRTSRVSVMEVACRFQTDEMTRGLEVKQALTNIIARLVYP